MKKGFVSLFWICILLFTGCQNRASTPTEYKLIVNDVVVPNTYDLTINPDNCYAELPLVAIAETLGAQVIRDNSSNYEITEAENVTITYNNHSLFFNTAEKDWNIYEPEWLDKPIRRIEHDELIVDSTSVASLFYHGWGIDMTIDYQNAIVYIDTLNTASLALPQVERDKINCRLVVNGEDITEGNYVYINHNESNAELPVTAIVQALGGTVSWYPSGPYSIKDRCVVAVTIDEKTLEYDTSKVDFGIGFLTSVSGQTRKVVGNEIVVDSETLYTVFYHLFHVNIVVDYVDSVVYVTSL